MAPIVLHLKSLSLLTKSFDRIRVTLFIFLKKDKVFIESEENPMSPFTRDNPLSLTVACHYFTYAPLRRACPNDAAYMDPLIVAGYLGMP